MNKIVMIMFQMTLPLAIALVGLLVTTILTIDAADTSMEVFIRERSGRVEPDFLSDTASEDDVIFDDGKDSDASGQAITSSLLSKLNIEIHEPSHEVRKREVTQ